MAKEWFIKQRIDEETFIEICKNAQSMSEAASKLGLHFNSFKKRAIELNCYTPNQAGISIRKSMLMKVASHVDIFLITRDFHVVVFKTKKPRKTARLQSSPFQNIL